MIKWSFNHSLSWDPKEVHTQFQSNKWDNQTGLAKEAWEIIYTTHQTHKIENTLVQDFVKEQKM